MPFNVAERQLKSVDKKHRATPLHQEIEAMALDPDSEVLVDEDDDVDSEAAA